MQDGVGTGSTVRYSSVLLEYTHTYSRQPTVDFGGSIVSYIQSLLAILLANDSQEPKYRTRPRRESPGRLRHAPTAPSQQGCQVLQIGACRARNDPKSRVFRTWYVHLSCLWALASPLVADLVLEGDVTGGSDAKVDATFMERQAKRLETLRTSVRKIPCAYFSF